MLVDERLSKKIDKIKELIAKKTEPKKVILFGSLAKKTPTIGFDIDIFVYKGKILSHREERRLKEEVDKLAGIYSVDVIFSDRVEKDFQKMVKNTGVVLYEKSRSWVCYKEA